MQVGADANGKLITQTIDRSQHVPLPPAPSDSMICLRASAFFQFMFGSVPRKIGPLETAAVTWMNIVVAKQEEFQFMSLAGDALGYKAMSMASGDRAHDVYSMELYGKAMCALRAASRTVTEKNALQLLVSAVALMLYEVCVC